jgi:hypothetical protein
MNPRPLAVTCKLQNEDHERHVPVSFMTKGKLNFIQYFNSRSDFAASRPLLSG